jgi:hypothetical protein
MHISEQLCLVGTQGVLPVSKRLLVDKVGETASGVGNQRWVIRLRLGLLLLVLD